MVLFGGVGIIHLICLNKNKETMKNLSREFYSKRILTMGESFLVTEKSVFFNLGDRLTVHKDLGDDVPLMTNEEGKTEPISLSRVKKIYKAR